MGPPKWERAKWDLARPHRRPHTKYARTRAQESTAARLPTYLGYSAIWSGRSSCGRQFEKRSQRMSAAQPMHTHAHVCLRTSASASALTSRSGRGAWAASRAEPLLLLATTACVASRTVAIVGNCVCSEAMLAAMPNGRMTARLAEVCTGRHGMRSSSESPPRHSPARTTTRRAARGSSSPGMRPSARTEPIRAGTR